MNTALITCSILASLAAATAVTSLTSEVVKADEAGPGVEQPMPTSRDDCSIQVWPNFSQSCLRGRDTHVTVRNVSAAAIDRRWEGSRPASIR